MDVVHHYTQSGRIRCGGSGRATAWAYAVSCPACLKLMRG